MWDMRAQQYFKSEESFHAAMKLFQQFLKASAQYPDFESLSKNFFDNLDDSSGNDTDLLERAVNYHASIQLQSGQNPYARELEQLKQLVQSHITTSSGSSSSANKLHAVKIDDAFDEFIRQRVAGWRSDSTAENSYRVSYYPIFKAVVGDVLTTHITKRHINDFIGVVLSLPANKTKIAAYKDKSVLDFPKLNIPDKHKLSATSQEKYLSRIGMFLKWLRTNDYTDVELALPLTNIKLNKKQANEKRSIYTKSDLKKLFNSEKYRHGNHKMASHFWVPLIGIHTGARLNEICQLGIDDIRQDPATDRWVFDINADQSSDPHKSLKQPYHARLVPIHKRLIELGILDYHKALKAGKQKRVFPDLPYVSNNNRYGDKLQRWFNRTYRNECGITTANTSFHSLRHTVITHLVNDKGVDPNKIAIGLGQTPIGGVTQTVYTKRQSHEAYFKYFDQIDFSDAFDTKEIRGWKFHLFNRKPSTKNQVQSTQPLVPATPAKKSSKTAREDKTASDKSQTSSSAKKSVARKTVKTT